MVREWWGRGEEGSWVGKGSAAHMSCIADPVPSVCFYCAAATAAGDPARQRLRVRPRLGHHLDRCALVFVSRTAPASEPTCLLSPCLPTPTIVPTCCFPSLAEQ